MTATRPRLTPAQRETLARLARQSQRGSGEWWVRVSPDGLGSRTTIRTLARKGYVETWVDYGPRGGEILYARPVPVDLPR